MGVDERKTSGRGRRTRDDAINSQPQIIATSAIQWHANDSAIIFNTKIDRTAVGIQESIDIFLWIK